MLEGIKKMIRHNPLLWKYVLNGKHSIPYMFSAKYLTAFQIRIVRDLKKDGIAFATIEEFLADKTLYLELEQAINQLMVDNKADIEQTRAQVDQYSDESKKTFLKMFLGQFPKFEATSIWNRFARQKEFQQVANAYFEMKDTEVREYNVWLTMQTQGEPRTSQLWHRDRDDIQILKIFVYLNDVDHGSGPLTYAPGTHRLGNIKKHPDFHLEKGVRRSTDSQMAIIVPEKKWITAIGKKGSIIFADTHGYHKGGLARTSDRLLYNFMYNSPACQRNFFTN